MNSAPQGRTTLITGGAGFIGSHLADLLVRDGHHVTVVDNLSTGRRSNLAGIDGSRLTFIEDDVESALPTLDPQSFDAIYHLAAAVGVRLVIERPVHTIRTNVLDTMQVLDFAAAVSLPVLIASTSEVYGKSMKTPMAEDDDVTYGPTIYSRWSYACSKAIDEYLALAYSRQRDLPVVVARFFNTVGPRQIGRYGMVIPRFVQAALEDRPIEVHGDGKQSRCFCDVRDVVSVLPKLMSLDSCRGRVFNIGHDQSIEIGQLAELVCATLGSRSPINLVSYEEALGEGFDDLRHRQPDLTRLRSVTGFAATISLEQTICDLAAEMQTSDVSGGSPEEAGAR